MTTATQAARPSEITVVTAARPTRPSCEAAAEKSAVTRAADKTAIATPKLRHPGRSIPRLQRTAVESESATCISLESFATTQLTFNTVYPSRIENQPAKCRCCEQAAGNRPPGSCLYERKIAGETPAVRKPGRVHGASALESLAP